MEYDDAGNLTRMDLFGDMNCDGVVSSSDNGAFVLAMTDPEEYEQTFPECSALIGDFDGNGSIGSGDIGHFVAALTAGGSSRVFSYDEENRLTSVTVGSLQLTINYDALGRRVLSTEYPNLEQPCTPPATADEVHTRHIYLGLTPIEEHRRAFCDVNPDVPWGLAREYLWGENFPEPLALIDWTEAGDVAAGNEEWLYYLRDVLGNVVGLATPEDQQASGAQSELVERYVYDPYGKTYIETWIAGTSSWDRVSASRFGNPFMWTGQRYDASVGLYHFLSRSHSPDIGCWLQRDPLGYIDGVNLYQMARAMVFVFIDALGEAVIRVSVDGGGRLGDGSSNTGGSSEGAGASSSKDYGHAWIDVYDDNGNRTGSGFYPGGDGAGREAKDGRTYPGVHQDDTKEGHKKDGSVDFPVTQEQADRATDYIRKHESDPPRWSLDNNCTTFVCQTLAEAGIKVDDSQIKTFGWDDPAKLYEYLQKKYPSSQPSTPPAGPSCPPAQKHVCFTPDTMIHTAAGLCAISEVAIGDTIVAMSDCGELKAASVLGVRFGTASELVILTTSTGESLSCTPEHPFLLSSGDWVRASDLTVESELISLNGNVTLARITKRGIAPGTDVITLTVDYPNTFAVSACGIVVHNKAP